MRGSIFIDVRSNGIAVIGRDDSETIVRTVDEFFAATGEDPRVLCSSSVDFPEEYTSDPEVLELVRVLFHQD